jgi:hypothetical protein
VAAELRTARSRPHPAEFMILVESVDGGGRSRGAVAGLDMGRDALDSVAKVVMFPNAYHHPSGRLQRGSGLLIALCSSGEFRAPVPIIYFWLAAVFRACVPETRAVEDSDPCPREDDVRPGFCALGCGALVS